MKIAVLFVVIALAGCIEDAPEVEAPTPFPLEVYRHAWPGSDVFVEGATLGMAFSVSNPTDARVSVGLFLDGIGAHQVGALDRTDGDTPIETWFAISVDAGEVRGAGRVLEPGEGSLFLAKVSSLESNNLSATFVASDPLDVDVLYDSLQLDWSVESVLDREAIDPGSLVQTTTVGLWTNGTSFYTNSAELLADPAFPAGGNVDRKGATDTLPVYVYDNENTEQPLGNADNCYFTTIAGYNSLLKTQFDGSTGVNFLSPTAGYTAPGNENHLLFGDSLVFLNTVIVLDGQTTTEDELPDPNGACFDATRVVNKVAAALPIDPPVV